MIARPIVAAPLAGLILGEPVTGMWMGVVLEVVSLHQLPIGAARHWDTGPAAIAGAAMLVGSDRSVAALLAAVGFAAIVGWVGAWSMHVLRQVNSSLVVVGDTESASPGRVASGHLAAMGLDFVRAGLLTSVGLALVAALGHVNGAAPPALWAAGLLLLICVSLALGADARAMVGGRRIWGFFIGAAALSAILTLWLA